MEIDSARERRDSVSSTKRKRQAVEDKEDGEGFRYKVIEELEEYLFTEANKISKAAALFVLRRFRKMEELLTEAELKRIETEATFRGIQMAKPAGENGP